MSEKQKSVGSPHVSATQNVPSMHHYSATGSLLQDDTNDHVSSPANKSAQLPDEPAKYRDDIELDDNALETIEIKELNQMLKIRFILC